MEMYLNSGGHRWRVVNRCTFRAFAMMGTIRHHANVRIPTIVTVHSDTSKPPSARVWDV
jgi:hypothetical protein